MNLKSGVLRCAIPVTCALLVAVHMQAGQIALAQDGYGPGSRDPKSDSTPSGLKTATIAAIGVGGVLTIASAVHGGTAAQPVIPAPTDAPGPKQDTTSIEVTSAGNNDADANKIVVVGKYTLGGLKKQVAEAGPGGIALMTEEGRYVSCSSNGDTLQIDGRQIRSVIAAK